MVGSRMLREIGTREGRNIKKKIQKRKWEAEISMETYNSSN